MSYRFVSRVVIVILVLLTSGKTVYSGVSSDSTGILPVIVEAESGVLGSKITIDQDDDYTYITTNGDYLGQLVPEDTNSVITFQVTFRDSGNYSFFARIWVGRESYNDDSFFAGKGFGIKNDTLVDDWVLINGLADIGFSDSMDVVDESGSEDWEQWKWVNLTNVFYSDLPGENYFHVHSDSLTKTFQIAGRENGLLIDKFAFCRSDLYYSVQALDMEYPGSTTLVIGDPPLAAGLPKFLGNVKGYNDSKFANYWNQLTPGNEGKWASVAGSNDTNEWNWNSLDALYEYSKKRDIIFKGHTLIWGNQQPSWIESLDSAQQIIYIAHWIRTIGERYPDMEMIDVVNEPLHDPPRGELNGNYIEALGGNGVTGWDWVVNAFKLARKYLPNTKLILNDYHIINFNFATTQYLEIIDILIDSALIDGIGVQAHSFEIENASVSTLKYNLDRLMATGLPIYISEMDLGNKDKDLPPDDLEQLKLYKKLFPVFWEHPGVKGITLWGYIENQMWQETCHLVHSNGSWRPAMDWLNWYISGDTSEWVDPVIEEPPIVTESSFAMKPSNILLGQNIPNPFVGETEITFHLSSFGYTALTIYDLQGRIIERPIAGFLNVGEHRLILRADEMDPGIYYYELSSNGERAVRKMLLLE